MALQSKGLVSGAQLSRPYHVIAEGSREVRHQLKSAPSLQQSHDMASTDADASVEAALCTCAWTCSKIVASSGKM